MLRLYHFKETVTLSYRIVDGKSWDGLPEKERLAEFEETTKRLPAKGVGQPEDIAEAVRYLIQCGYAGRLFTLMEGLVSYDFTAIFCSRRV